MPSRGVPGGSENSKEARWLEQHKENGMVVEVRDGWGRWVGGKGAQWALKAIVRVLAFTLKHEAIGELGAEE